MQTELEILFTKNNLPVRMRTSDAECNYMIVPHSIGVAMLNRCFNPFSRKGID